MAKNKQKRPHLTQRGVFRSDKYEWCKPGFLALKLTDPDAQDLIAEYADRRIEVDQEFGEDLHTALAKVGYSEKEGGFFIPNFIGKLLGFVRGRPSQYVA